RAGIKQPLARLAIGVPGHMISACGRDRKTWPMMRARSNLPIVLADAANLARCLRIAKRHDRVIPDTALKDVPEHDHGTARAGEGKSEPAALAGVVACQPRLGIGRAAVFRRREEQPCSLVLLAFQLRWDPVSLVDPCGKHRTVSIEPQRHETLALVV